MPRERSVTSRELIDQSDALRKEAETLKKREIPGVVEQIKIAIAHYGLTAADLGFGTSGRPVGARKQKAAAKGRSSKKSADSPAKAPAVVKYKDGAGSTWSGRGPQPKWFKEALANGVSQESLLA